MMIATLTVILVAYFGSGAQPQHTAAAPGRTHAAHSASHGRPANHHPLNPGREHIQALVAPLHESIKTTHPGTACLRAPHAAIYLALNTHVCLKVEPIVMHATTSPRLTA